jgi:hypothetical protein
MPSTPCPHCKQPIKFNAEDIGLTATCPYCRVDFELRGKEKSNDASNRFEPDEEYNAAAGWLWSIVIIVLVNLLSFIFDWPFWLY